MSYSDYTFSSPRRKKSDKDKSIDDDEFERFLNDSSTSDVTYKNKKKRQQNEPWWMNSEENKNTNKSTSKSFVKQKKPVLTTPLEVDETNEAMLSLTKQKQKQPEETIEKSNFESDEYKFVEEDIHDELSEANIHIKPRPRSRSKQSLSIQESFESTMSTTEKNDDEETEHHEHKVIDNNNKNNNNNNNNNNYKDVILSDDDESKRKYSSRLDYNFDDKSKHSLFDDELSMILRESTSNFHADKGNDMVKKNDEYENVIKTSLEMVNFVDVKEIQPIETLSTTKGDHLLSKVIFLDTLESVVDKGPLGNIKQIEDLKSIENKQNEDVKENDANNNNNGKKKLKVQISEDRIERHIDDDDDDDNEDIKEVSLKLDDDDLTQSIDIQMYYDQNENDLTYNKGTRENNDTQTRNDFEQLQKLYLKNLQTEMTHALNTTTTYGAYGVSKTKFDDSNLIKSITNELEDRALHDILNELNLSSTGNKKQPIKYKKFNTNVTTKPPKKDKYNYVKSSGYGKSNCSSVQTTEPELMHTGEFRYESDKIEDYIKDTHSLNNVNQATNDVDYLMDQINNLMSEREKDRNLLVKIREEFTERDKEHRKNIEAIKKQNETNEKQLKTQIQQLTRQLIEKQNLIKQQIIEKDKIASNIEQHENLEKKLNEQDQLISGYQNENERLYSELKQIKEGIKFQQQQNDIENQKLKIELINKNIQIDNLKQQLSQQPKIIQNIETDTMNEELLRKCQQRDIEISDLRNEIATMKQKLERQEENHLKYQLNANGLINEHRIEIKKFEEEIKELKDRENKRPVMDKNYKKLKDDFMKLSEENKGLKLIIEELKLNESDFIEKIRQLDNHIRMNDANANKKQYDSNNFKELLIQNKNDYEEEIAKYKDENMKLTTSLNEANKKLEKFTADFETNLSQIKNTFNAQVQNLKQQHKNELEKQLNEILIKTQQVNELKLKLDEQKIFILKFKEINASNEKLKDINKFNEDEIKCLNTEILKLKNDLHLARLYHSPNMKHFDVLNDKLKSIEKKYIKREKELQNVLSSTNGINGKMSVVDLDDFESNQHVLELVKNYQKIIESKDKELIRFRLELDSMLELLQALQN